eukprot:9116816-Ditylum_brightwellii.AAC.1
MPEVNEVFYAKHREHDGCHCAYILLSINHDMEFLVMWFGLPMWGEISNVKKKNSKQRKREKQKQYSYDILKQQHKPAEGDIGK